MWKVKDPDAATISVEKKDEFTIDANEGEPGAAVRMNE